MKSLSVKLGVILVVIGFNIFHYAEVWGEDWKYFAGTDEGEMYFYDVTSITRPSKNIARVWVRIYFSEEELKILIAEFGGKYFNLLYQLTLIEYDCGEKRMRFLTTTIYAKNGTVIESSDFRKMEFYFVRPETIEESLYKAVCK